MSPPASLSDSDEPKATPGPCVKPTCKDKCFGFISKKKYANVCKCGHGDWFHQTEDEEDEEEEDGGDEEKSGPTGSGDDEDEDEASREVQLKAHFGLAAFTESFAHANDKKAGDPLRSATRSFKGSVSGKVLPVKNSPKLAPTIKGKAPVQPTVSLATISKPRKPSGPRPSDTKTLGGLFLLNRAVDHILAEATANCNAGQIRLTRNNFNRSHLDALGLRYSHPSDQMELNRNWSMEQFDEFVLLHYPLLFDYVQTKLPDDHTGYMWILFTRQGQELHQSTCSERDLNMQYIWNEVFKVGKGVQQQELWLGTKVSIPDSIVRELLGREEPTTLALIPADHEGHNENAEVENKRSEEMDEVAEYSGRITRARANSREHLVNSAPMAPVKRLRTSTKSDKLASGQPDAPGSSPVKRSHPTPDLEDRKSKKLKFESKPALLESDSDGSSTRSIFPHPASPTVVNLVSPSPSPTHQNPWILIQDVDLEDDLLNF